MLLRLAQWPLDGFLRSLSPVTHQDIDRRVSYRLIYEYRLIQASISAANRVSAAATNGFPPTSPVYTRRPESPVAARTMSPRASKLLRHLSRSSGTKMV